MLHINKTNISKAGKGLQPKAATYVTHTSMSQHSKQ